MERCLLKTKYTREQRAIINAPEEKILVNASAGTGKTFTLIEAATKVIKEEGASKIAVFTLTRDAAQELKDRFEILPAFVGTIHAFALNELAKMEEEKLLVSEIMSDKRMKDLLLNSYIQYYDIKRGYKEEVNDIFRFMTDRSYNPDIGTASKYTKIINHYIRRKKEFGLYDYTDAPEYYFKKARELNYKTKYTHLYVDEVQDIDLWEYNIVSNFKGRVFAIGDPRQNIYQFRNSITSIFEKLEKIGYNIYILTKNFRSYQEILDYAGATLEAVRGSGGTITNTSLFDVEDNITILCRYNLQVRELLNYFDDVRTVHSYKGLEDDNIFIVNFAEDNEENENIMFVAKTRARNKLGIDTFDNTIKKGREIKYGL